MPNYEYQCTQCQKTFDVRETFEEHERHKQVKCPKCGSPKVRQLIGTCFVQTSKKS